MVSTDVQWLALNCSTSNKRQRIVQWPILETVSPLAIIKFCYFASHIQCTHTTHNHFYSDTSRPIRGRHCHSRIIPKIVITLSKDINHASSLSRRWNCLLGEYNECYLTTKATCVQCLTINNFYYRIFWHLVFTYSKKIFE